MATVKMQKLQNQIERAIAKILLEDVKANVGFITITGVDLTNDLSFAKIYYSVLGNEDKKDSVKDSLEKSKGFIRTTLGSRVQMRKIPNLIFVYDESIDYGNKIDKLLNQINKKGNE